MNTPILIVPSRIQSTILHYITRNELMAEKAGIPLPAFYTMLN